MFDWIAELSREIGESIGEALSSAWERISDSIWNNFLGWLYGTVCDALSDFFSLMAEIGANLFDLEWVKAALRFFSLFGWGMFVSGLIIAVFDTAIEYQNMGKLHVKKQIMPFLYGLLAVNLFTVVPVELFRFSVTLQGRFAKDLIAQAAGRETGVSEEAGRALNFLVSGNPTGHSNLLNLLLVICLGYCVVKCFFSNVKRGGILLIQIAVGSFHLFSLPRGHTEGFAGWCRQIVAICFTTFMQTTLLLLGLVTMESRPLIGIGVMLSANEVPRIAQQFGLETGVRVNMMSAIRTTGMAVRLGKSIVKR